MDHRTGTERVGEAVRTGPWLGVYEDLSARDPASLTAVELDALAEAAWWLCRTGESIAARHRAHAAFREAKDDRGAARTAARLFHEHFYRGERAVAVGWLRRGLRHVDQDPGGVECGWLQFAEAELHLHQGPLDAAVDHATQAVQIARRHGDDDLAAVGMQLQGRALIAQGRVDEGLGLLDEAMTFVLAGELAPLAAGWVYCSVILACKDLADLVRAGEWTEAARVWCAALPETTPYSQGLCRVYRGEVLALRGAWAEAEAEMRRAHQELLPHKPQGAAEASYGVGEVLRRRGDLAGAERAFVRAQQLGWDPQPGMALLRLAQGRVDAAAAALRSALASPMVDRFARARLLAAQVDVAIAGGMLHQARDAVRELVMIADGLASAVVQATASTTLGALQLAEGDPAAALKQLRRALQGWRELALPYEQAKTRLLIGETQRVLGDEESGRIEIDAARAGFDRLGAAVDARHAAALLRRRRAPRPLLTDREVQVLRLVAAGRSNRDIAGALQISEHTVARHVQNLFAKLGVSSRAAATSHAHQGAPLSSWLEPTTCAPLAKLVDPGDAEAHRGSYGRPGKLHDSEATMTGTSAFDPIQYKADIRVEWRAAAPGWRAWVDVLEAEDGGRAVSRSLAELAGIGPGDAVLDVAAGYGEPGLTAARAVAPDGHVVCTDISAEMLAVGRERAAAEGLGNVEFIDCDAEELAFREASFDAVLSRQGLQFLPDVAGVLARLHSFLKPHGRLAAAVWGPPQAVQFAAPVPLIRDELQLPPPPAGTPGPFALADAGQLAALVEAAGFTDVETGTVTAIYQTGSPELATRWLRDVAPPIASLVDGQPPGVQRRV